MARRPNYRFERFERDRAKAAKKAARLEARKERAEKRKAEKAGLALPGEPAPTGESAPADEQTLTAEPLPADD